MRANLSLTQSGSNRCLLQRLFLNLLLRGGPAGTYWRQRNGLVQAAGRHIQRMQKTLTQMNIQLAVLDGSGNLSEYVGTVIDVTERKRAEQELRKSEEDLRTITDTIRQPIGLGEELDETGGDGGGIPARQVVARTRYRHCVDFWNPLLQ